MPRMLPNINAETNILMTEYLYKCIHSCTLLYVRKPIYIYLKPPRDETRTMRYENQSVIYLKILLIKVR